MCDGFFQLQVISSFFINYSTGIDILFFLSYLFMSLIVGNLIDNRKVIVFFNQLLL